jgi:tripartite-type tricarboxylate transporter receptor subunit TctC
MLAPAGVPRDIIARVHQEIVAALRKDLVREKLTAQGYRVVANTPAEFSQLIAREIDKWAKVVKVARIPTIGGTN